MPLVSVIIPTYNRADFVAEAIQSVQHQTHSDVEIIVVDDASTDNTCEIVRALAAEDERITLICQPENRRVNAARNAGLARATGEFVNFLDSDDLLALDKLEKQLAVFADQPQLDMVICQTLVFRGTMDQADRSWNVLDPALTDYRALLEQYIPGDIDWSVLAPLWRRSFLNTLLPLPETLYASDERELHLRAVCHAPAIAILPEPLAYAREHDRPSGKKEFHKPFKMRAQLKAQWLMWQTLQLRGLDTPTNRRNHAATVLVRMREWARARRWQFAFAAWWLAFRILPTVRDKIVMISIVLPVLNVVLLTRQGNHALKRIVRKFNLERRLNQYRKLPYTAS